MKLLFSLLVVLGALLVASTSCGIEDPDVEAARERRDVQITVCEANEFGVTVGGSVTNHSSKRSDYEIDVKVETPDGVQTDSGRTWVRNLDPGQSALWDVRAEGVPGAKCEIAQVDRSAA